MDDSGSLKAVAGAWRHDEAGLWGNGTSLLWQEFPMNIEFDTGYVISMRYTGSKIIYTCNDETITYDITTDTYKPYEDMLELQTRVNAVNGTSGYLKTQFDNV